MSISQIVFTIFTVIALSIGQILFKLSSSDLEFSLSGLINIFLSMKLIAALFVYFIATIMWLFVLRNTPLRLAYPFVALAFFIVPVLAHFLLGERVNWNTFAGAGLIAAGVLVSVYQ